MEVLLSHFFAIFKVSRQWVCDRDLQPSRPRLAILGLETSLETETKSRDSITGFEEPFLTLTTC